MSRSVEALERNMDWKQWEAEVLYVNNLPSQPEFKPEPERRFLVENIKQIPGGYLTSIPHRTRVGYLDNKKNTRLKYIDGPDGVSRTKGRKRGRGLDREEKEKLIEADDFDRLWKKTKGRRGKKDRYIAEDEKGTVFEIDVFRGRKKKSTIIVEIEFPTKIEAMTYKPPDWLRNKKGKIKEVTGKSEWSTRSLVTVGPPGRKLKHQ